MPRREINGAELHYELQGSGPPVLLVMGGTGDGGHFARLAPLLADEFTVVTYDRRGNGRSPRPPGWSRTSPEEQADDAAALLAALDLAPAVVFGTSSGANFALCLLIRHPEVVRGAVLHEPVLARLYDDPEALAPMKALVQDGIAAGGPPLGLERFWRYVAGDAGWERLDPVLRERMLASAETFFGCELGTFEGYLPDAATLAATTTPVMVLASAETEPYRVQAAGRLAERFGTEVTRTPGTHAAYHDHPDELAQTLRPFLRSATSS